MEYKGKLYGKVGRHYFPLQETTEDFEMLENRLEFYREQTDKLRKFVFDNNIGQPSQNIFNAVLEYLKTLHETWDAARSVIPGHGVNDDEFTYKILGDYLQKNKRPKIFTEPLQMLPSESKFRTLLLCPTCNKGSLYTKNGYIWCDNKKCNAIFEQQDTLD